LISSRDLRIPAKGSDSAAALGDVGRERDRAGCVRLLRAMAEQRLWPLVRGSPPARCRVKSAAPWRRSVPSRHMKIRGEGHHVPEGIGERRTSVRREISMFRTSFDSAIRSKLRSRMPIIRCVLGCRERLVRPEREEAGILGGISWSSILMLGGFSDCSSGVLVRGVLERAVKPDAAVLGGSARVVASELFGAFHCPSCLAVGEAQGREGG
jgi:hypothetical protein